MNAVRKKQSTVVVSGYFNPLHVGHLDMIEGARKLGDRLVVIVNNDYQVALKGSVPFMRAEERVRIVQALAAVDDVVLSIDVDKTVCETLRMIKPDMFANGGDRPDTASIPETSVCEELGIEMVFGIGDKIQSSSWLIENAAHHVRR